MGSKGTLEVFHIPYFFLSFVVTVGTILILTMSYCCHIAVSTLPAEEEAPPDTTNPVTAQSTDTDMGNCCGSACGVSFISN